MYLNMEWHLVFAVDVVVIWIGIFTAHQLYEEIQHELLILNFLLITTL